MIVFSDYMNKLAYVKVAKERLDVISGYEALLIDKSQAYGRPIVAALYCKGRQQFRGLFCSSFVIFLNVFIFIFFP
ncbi:hypothetical protein DsansV1_C01g0010291 [Dioscorea sansibarensis]